MNDTQRVFQLKQAYGTGLLPPGTHLLCTTDSAQFQNKLVDDLLLARHFRDFPPSKESQRIFWKWVVEIFEEKQEEVDERIYDAYINLLTKKSSSFVTQPPSPAYITHFWSISPGATSNTHRTQLTTLLESRTMIESGTTGLRTWGASITFANWLVAHPDVIQGRRVLELGSGAGFLGLIIAALQLDHLNGPGLLEHSCFPNLILSDANSEVLERCRQNFQLACNNMNDHPCLDFRLLDWSDALDSEANLDPDSPLNETLKNVNTIVGADLVYDVSIIPALVAVLVLFFRTKQVTRVATRNCSAYIALTMRREQTIYSFLSSLLSHGLGYDEMEITEKSRWQFLGGPTSDANCKVKLVRITR
ncbi:hypothetical protein K439DRAFT_1416909 [Ramaria rubella]|nr:hypothetical protein K439DRAFT_1416909 [Ramaria rubella]